LFKTQYALIPVHGGGGFLSHEHLAQLQGEHSRMHSRVRGSGIYIAGIDIAGESEVLEEQILTRPGRDATVITIAELEASTHRQTAPVQPVIKVIEHYCWTGKKHPLLFDQMITLLKNVWKCSRIAIDATGIGEPVASFLKQALGAKVIPIKFSQSSKSELGFDLLAAINADKLKLYRQDGSPEYREMMFQLEKARSVYRPNQTINFFVDPADGHDDYLMSLALVVRAARDYAPRRAIGR